VQSPGRPTDNPISPNVSPPVLWIKDNPAPFNLHELPNDCSHESYHDFRRNAMKQREQSTVNTDQLDMQSLYGFWAHFLIRNFNARMYQEFKGLAFEDAERGSTSGKKSLLQYYNESILSQKTIADDNIARDFVELVKSERSNAERPAFNKLRAVWRNGAFNMKNRHKLTKFIDAELNMELER
jgi:la-related protein 1